MNIFRRDTRGRALRKDEAEEIRTLTADTLARQGVGAKDVDYNYLVARNSEIVEDAVKASIDMKRRGIY